MVSLKGSLSGCRVDTASDGFRISWWSVEIDVVVLVIIINSQQGLLVLLVGLLLQPTLLFGEGYNKADDHDCADADNQDPEDFLLLLLVLLILVLVEVQVNVEGEVRVGILSDELHVFLGFRQSSDVECQIFVESQLCDVVAIDISE